MTGLVNEKYLDTLKNTFVERSSQYTSFSSKKPPANARSERKQFTENASVGPSDYLDELRIHDALLFC